jgi:hypothetical protein
VIVGASLLVVPIGLYWYYIVNVVPMLSVALSLESNQSLVGSMSLAGMSKLTPFVSLAGFGLFALFSFNVNSNRWASAFGKRTLREDAMFLMNILVMLLFDPRSLVYPYVWVILPLALFLSTLLMEGPKLAYLALIGFATCFLNSSSGAAVLSFIVYPASLPTFMIGNLIMAIQRGSLMIGNLMMVTSLILIYLCPYAIFRRVKNHRSAKILV